VFIVVADSELVCKYWAIVLY